MGLWKFGQGIWGNFGNIVCMKIKLSKNQWEFIGKKAGLVRKSPSESVNEVKQIIDDGQRAYRLKKTIGACPDFDNSYYQEAWKFGYRMAMQKMSLEEAYTNFMFHKKEYKSNEDKETL